jgi:hypothetical protein
VKRGQGARREPDVRGSRLIQYNVLLEAARTKSKRAPGQLSSGQVNLTSDICATQPKSSPRMHRPIGHLSGTQGNKHFSANLALFPIVDLIDLGCGGACWSAIELVACGCALHEPALKRCQLTYVLHVPPCLQSSMPV